MINHQQVFAARDENEPADWDTSIDLLLMVVGLSVSILVEIMAARASPSFLRRMVCLLHF